MTSPSVSGKYTCSANNGFVGRGDGTSAYATLMVYGKVYFM